MRRVLHMSDLHFGRVNPELETPLVDLCNRLAPDLIVISGDFTQRARVSQFREAEAFVARLEPPVLSVPGNHDTPLDNLFVRFFDPWGRYRDHIDTNLEPEWHDGKLKVVGVNTVNRFSWQRGRIRGRTRRRVARALKDETRTSIAVLHHPLEHLPEVEKRLMRGARKAAAILGEAGADIVLSGHLHNANVAPLTAQPGVLFVQAGTGLSTRLRGEANTFNLLTIAPDHIAIDRYSATEQPEFTVTERAEFDRSDAGWRQRT